MELDNLDKLVLCNDIIGIWSQIDVKGNYPFSKVEKENITKVRKMLDEGINNYTIYKYGLYVSSVVGSIKGISYKKINDIYENLPIYNRKEIKINGEDIAKILDREPGNYIKEILDDIEKKIIDGTVINDKDKLVKYITSNYGG